MSEERRANANPFDIAGLLAILYTTGYLGMCALLYYVSVPLANEKPLLVLFGVMSSIQLQLIGFYYGGSRQVESTQRSTEQRAARLESTVQEIAKAPIAAAAKLADKETVQPWVTGKDYVNEQVVSPNGSGIAYVCIVPHTSGVFKDDLTSGKWALKNP